MQRSRSCSVETHRGRQPEVQRILVIARCIFHGGTLQGQDLACGDTGSACCCALGLRIQQQCIRVVRCLVVLPPG